MKLYLLAGFTLAFTAATCITQAQQTPAAPAAPTTQAAPPQRPPLPPLPSAPGSKYDYHETFGPLFYTKNGTEYRAADGEPGPKYWQNRADYQLAARLNDQTNEIAGSEILTYTNNSPQTLGYLWMNLEQNIFRQDSRSNAIVPLVAPQDAPNAPVKTSRNWGRGQVFDAGDKIKSITMLGPKGASNPSEISGIRHPYGVVFTEACCGQRWTGKIKNRILLYFACLWVRPNGHIASKRYGNRQAHQPERENFPGSPMVPPDVRI